MATKNTCNAMHYHICADFYSVTVGVSVCKLRMKP